MAPGSTVTSAAAIVVAIGKFVESTILTVPPLNCVTFIWDMAKENPSGTPPIGSGGADASTGGGATIYRVSGIY